MPLYEPRFYKGDYRERQEAANADRCVAYIEQHFNSSGDSAADYTVAIVGSNASQTSCNWGRWWSGAVSRDFGTRLGGADGILKGGYEGRGDANLRFTSMPAVLLEPLFGSNARHAGWIRSDAGQDRLAAILVESVQRFFPAGGRIALSVGHKYKTSSPNDRGAAVAGGGWEADFAEAVLKKVEGRLLAVAAPAAGRTLRVVHGSKVLLETTVDEDAVLRWDPVRGLLQVVDEP